MTSSTAAIARDRTFRVGASRRRHRRARCAARRPGQSQNRRRDRARRPPRRGPGRGVSIASSGEASSIRCPTSSEPTPSIRQRWVLAGERPAAVVQPVDQRHLPERAVTVQTMGPELAEPVLQLGLAAGRRQRGVMQVVVEVEAVRRLPGQPGQRAGMRVGEPLGEPRHDADPSANLLAHRGDVRRSPPGSGSKISAAPICMCALSSSCSSSRNIVSTIDSCSPMTNFLPSTPRER